jgi:Tfp pilus assembly protein PilZ
MPDAAVRAPGPQPGLSEIAGEFKRLDEMRRQRGLSLTEAGRYNTLFSQLSDALSANERHRKVDMRQFLRVRSPMELVLRTRAGEIRARCNDFGGGGCAVETAKVFNLGDDVYLDGVILDGTRHPLQGRGTVVWARLPTSVLGGHGYGIKFVIESPQMRDEVDRIVYRVLDLFLNDGRASSQSGKFRKIAI